MRYLAFAAAFAALTQPAMATGLTEPLVDPEVIVEETRDPTSGGFIIPLLLLALIVAITTGGGEPPVSELPKVPVL